MRTLIPVAIISVITIFLYKDLVGAYYQQEEWMTLGNIFTRGWEYIFYNSRGLLSPLLGQGRLFSSILVYFLIGQSPFNTIPLNLFSIAFHTVNAILVFLLAKNLTQKNIPSAIGALAFATNAVARGAVTWAAAGTLPATTLILLSLLCFFKGIHKSVVPKKKWLGLSLVLVYISLFFKEIGVFLFLLYPTVFLTMSKLPIKKVLKNKYAIILLIALVVTLWKIFQFKTIGTQDALFLTGANAYFLPVLIVRALMYPLTSFSLMLVPPESFLNFARTISNIYYPFFPEQQFILISQTVVLDLIATILSFGILAGLIAFAKNRDKKDRGILLFLVLFTLASFLPYIIISKTFSYLESRYYYVGAAGLGLIIAWLLSASFQVKKYVGWVTAFLVAVFIGTHAFVVQTDISKLADISQERKLFLSQLSSLKPALSSNKNIFLVNGSEDFYISGNKVPFQQGFGYTLMIWYYKSGNIPSELIKERTFFEIGSQGYREVGRNGFGYFSDPLALEAFLKKNPDGKGITVTKLYYDAKEKKLTENETP